jgi:protein TonB
MPNQPLTGVSLSCTIVFGRRRYEADHYSLDAEANVFNRLLESNPKRQRRLGGVVASTIVHTLLIALAVKATQLTAATPRRQIDVITPVYQPPRPQEPTASRANDRSSAGRQTETRLTPPTDVKPIGAIDLDIKGIPEPEPGPPSRPGDFDPTGLVTPGSRGLEAPNVNNELKDERSVDKAIIAIPGTGNPRYPATLQGAGLEGDVRAQFVVDTLGRVEHGSVRVLDTTHELFAAAVRDALTRAKFKPAEAGGHRVRQLAEQTFTFRITR